MQRGTAPLHASLLLRRLPQAPPPPLHCDAGSVSAMGAAEAGRPLRPGAFHTAAPSPALRPDAPLRLRQLRRRVAPERGSYRKGEGWEESGGRGKMGAAALLTFVSSAPRA